MIVVEAIVGKTTTMLRWRSRCQTGDDGDHDGASEIEITSTRWWWPYHITYIDCMWSPSPKHHHDHHRHRCDTLISIVASLSSRQLLLLRLSLPLSDKVKQLHGDCISYNKATTIRLLPVADNLYKTWSSHTTIYISSRLDHITSQHALQKQVRRPLLCCCKFYVAATGF